MRMFLTAAIFAALPLLAACQPEVMPVAAATPVTVAVQTVPEELQGLYIGSWRTSTGTNQLIVKIGPDWAQFQAINSDGRAVQWRSKGGRAEDGTLKFIYDRGGPRREDVFVFIDETSIEGRYVFNGKPLGETKLSLAPKTLVVNWKQLD